MAARIPLNGKARDHEGFFDPIAVNRLSLAVENYTTTLSREWRRGLVDPRRDVEDECGYPRLSEAVTVELYQQLYERNSIAARVVDIKPKESWQVQPRVYETEDAEEVTEFEEAWDALGQQLSGSVESYYQDESGSLVWEYLLRADVLSGIGQYGAILLGLDDGVDMSRPVKGIEEQGSAPTSFNNDSKTWDNGDPGEVYRLTVNAQRVANRRLLYLRTFPEHLVQITQFESNPTSPRYGQPLMYYITFNDWRTGSQTGIGLPMSVRNVHWTRVVHLADNRGSSEVFGVPRMRPVLNNILGLHKLYASSPEMYYKGAFPGLKATTHPQLGGDVEVDESAMRDSMEKYFNGLQRYLLGRGMDFATLSPTVSDPTSQINVQIEAICIEIDTPIRIFKGSERGELASSQDEKAHMARMRGRQLTYLTPKVICPLVDRLIQVGVLPAPKTGRKELTGNRWTVRHPHSGKLFVVNAKGEVVGERPKGGYSVEWPDMSSQSEAEKATVAVAKTDALSKYVQGGVEALVPPLDYLTRILGMDEEEAQAILEEAEKLAEEKMQEAEEQAGEMGFEASPPEGFQRPPPEPGEDEKQMFSKAEGEEVDGVKEEEDE